MSDLSRYAEDKMLDHVLKVAPFTRPANLFLTMMTAPATDLSSGSTISELTGGSFARIACDDWTSASGRSTVNNTSLTFPTPSADWGIANAFAIMDTSTLATGNVIAFGTLSPARNIVSGQAVKFDKYQLEVAYKKNGCSTYLANATLDHLFEGTPLTPPANIYAGFTDTAITDTDTGSTVPEPTSGYARTLENDWDAASLGESVNTDEFNSYIAALDWGAMKYILFADALTTGNILFHGELNSVYTIDLNDYITIDAGDISITLD